MKTSFVDQSRYRNLAVLISFILAAMAPAVRAVITEQISSIGFETPTVLLDSDEFDGDATTIRNGLHTNIEATIARTQFGDPALTERYRVVYSLEDESGVQISLANGDAGNDTQVTAPPFVVVLNGGIFVFPNSHVEDRKSVV